MPQKRFLPLVWRMCLNLKIILVFAAFVWSISSLEAQAVQITDVNDYLYPDEETSQTISMDFKAARLDDALKIFSQQSGLNFIASEDLADRTLTLYLDNVPVQEALERILLANGLTYELKPDTNIFIVKRIDRPDVEVTTRVYHLKNATLPTSEIFRTLTPNQDTAGLTSSLAQSPAGIIAAVQALLTQNGSVVEDPRTNSIIVTDIASRFSLIEETIARLDVPVPLILIEAEMLDVSKQTADLIGIRYGNTPAVFTGGSQESFYPFDTNPPLPFGFTETDPALRASTLSFTGLTATLQFLRTQTDSKSLANPRILTLNNQRAEISISTNEAIGLAANTTTAEGTATSVNEAERVQTGVFLTVTPQASVETGEITMAVEPRVIEAKTGATFGTQTFRDPEERGTRSVLRIKDGDTIVIGGLLRDDLRNVGTKLPGLSGIPFLGRLFRHDDHTNTQRELIVFITPHIVKDQLPSAANLAEMKQPGNLDDTFQVSGERLKSIEKEFSQFEKK